MMALPGEASALLQQPLATAGEQSVLHALDGVLPSCQGGAAAEDQAEEAERPQVGRDRPR